MPESIRIGLVAGEASGDQLGAPLIAELKKIFPNAIFEGIGGELMMAEGFNSLFPMERLSVMGFVDPLKRLPELLKIRKSLYQHFRNNRFDLFVGIDAPDFNLGLELKLREAGIKTAHYVSPSVWAWRQGRVKKIARAVGQMLTLFPFEAGFYRQHNVPVTFVGHPLADRFAELPDTQGARRSLELPQDATVIALMPGSRSSEVAMLGKLFLDVAARCQQQLDNPVFVMPAANQDRFNQLKLLVDDYPELGVKLLCGQSHQVMEASDLVLLASGTTALEAMLLKKPMVVSYKMGKMTFALLSRLVKTQFVSLPNLLSGRALVPEILQDDATVENISTSVLQQLTDQENKHLLLSEFSRLHQQLKCNNAVVAAKTLSGLING